MYLYIDSYCCINDMDCFLMKNVNIYIFFVKNCVRIYFIGFVFVGIFSLYFYVFKINMMF